MAGWLHAAKQWARQIKRDIVAIWLAARDPRTPWGPRIIAAAVAAYALSPVDLIPDFIPVLGYLDDLLIVPLGILLVIKLIPAGILAEHRSAAAQIASRPISRAGLAAIIIIWLSAAFWLVAVFTDVV